MQSSDKVLVFCGTKRKAEELAKILNNEGFRTMAIHGDKD